MEIADFSLFTGTFDPTPPTDGLLMGGGLPQPSSEIPGDWQIFLDEYRPVGGTSYGRFYPRPMEVLRRDLDDLGKRIATAMENLSNSGKPSNV